IKNNKALLLKRSAREKFLPGYFEMPGGKVEFGEAPEVALKREIKEETKLTISVIALFFTFSYTADLNNIHTIDIQYLVKVISPLSSLKLSKEHDEFAWVKLDELNNYKITDAMKLAINKGFAAHCPK
ncbi:NUDIX domain-containing protein, partial [bacterium]|nr:NUDIX domain-containing protein [bacterium]